MADFSIASQVQPIQTPNMLGMLEHVQKMQTSNMLMQQRAADLQKENAIRGAAAKHGVGSQGYIDAVARIDPTAALAAMNQQRQAAAAGASAAASAASAALSRLQGDKVTQDILAKKGDQFVMGLRSLESYPPEQQPVIYGKMYEAMPDTLKPFFNPIYSPKAAELAQMTAADFVAKAKENQPQLQPQEAGMPGRTAYMPGANGTLGTMVMVPEALPPGAVNTMMPQPGGVNNLVPGAGANFTPRPMPGVNNLAQPQTAMLPSQMRAQVTAQNAAAELAEKGAEETQKLEINKKFTDAEREEAKSEFDKTITNLVEQYKKLGSKGMLVGSDTTMANRAKAAAAVAAPGLTTIVSPERGGPVSTLANTRQTMLSALMGATGMSAKNIDSNAEMRAYLNSLSNPGQPVETIVDTLNNLSERFGTNRKLKIEDLTGSKPQNPSSAKTASPTNIHDAADAILRGEK